MLHDDVKLAISKVDNFMRQEKIITGQHVMKLEKNGNTYISKIQIKIDGILSSHSIKITQNFHRCDIDINVCVLFDFDTFDIEDIHGLHCIHRLDYNYRTHKNHVDEIFLKSIQMQEVCCEKHIHCWNDNKLVFEKVIEGKCLPLARDCDKECESYLDCLKCVCTNCNILISQDFTLNYQEKHDPLFKYVS